MKSYYQGCPDEVVKKEVDWLFLEGVCRWRKGAWDIQKGGDGKDNYFYCNHFLRSGGVECNVRHCPIWSIK